MLMISKKNIDLIFNLYYSTNSERHERQIQ